MHTCPLLARLLFNNEAISLAPVGVEVFLPPLISDDTRIKY